MNDHEKQSNLCIIYIILNIWGHIADIKLADIKLYFIKWERLNLNSIVTELCS